MLPYVSPRTGEPLQRDGDALVAPSGERYPIVRGIPRFPEGSSAAYTESFGVQWHLYAKTQLDSFTRTRLSRDRLERCLGDDVGSLQGKLVLEAGCGAGRFTEVLVAAGAMTHALDASAAVEVNAQNVGKAANYQVAQASLLEIPFPQQAFDVVLCLGVLQHTASPEESVRALYRMVKPGGLLVIDHYRYSWTTYFTGAFYTRLLLKRLPPATSHRIVAALVKTLFPLHSRLRSSPRHLRKLFRRMSPVIDYFNEYPGLTDELQYEFAKLDTFDSLTDHYKHLRSTQQIARLLDSLGVNDRAVWKGGNGVEARAVKPLRAETSPLGAAPAGASGPELPREKTARSRARSLR